MSYRTFSKYNVKIINRLSPYFSYLFKEKLSHVGDLRQKLTGVSSRPRLPALLNGYDYSVEQGLRPRKFSLWPWIGGIGMLLLVLFVLWWSSPIVFNLLSSQQNLKKIHQPNSALEMQSATDPIPTSKRWLQVQVKPGDTLVTIFQQQQLNRNDLYAILADIRHKKVLSRLYPKQQLLIQSNASGEVSALRIEVDKQRMLEIVETSAGFQSKLISQQANSSQVQTSAIASDAESEKQSRQSVAGWLEITVKPGDTLSNIFFRYGLSQADMHRILKLGGEVKRLHQLYPQQQFKVKQNGKGRVLALHFLLERETELRIERAAQDSPQFNGYLQQGEKTLPLSQPKKPTQESSDPANEVDRQSPDNADNTQQTSQSQSTTHSPTDWRQITVQKGDTLSKIFQRHQLSQADMHQILKLGGETRKLHQLYPQQTLRLKHSSTGKITTLQLEFAAGRKLVVEKQAKQFKGWTMVNGKRYALASSSRQVARSTADADDLDKVTTHQPTDSIAVESGKNTETLETEILHAEKMYSPVANTSLETVIANAKTFLGTPYVYGGETPKGFDCSGFVYYNMKEVGINVPRTAHQQYEYTSPVNRSNLQAGDLVFFRTSKSQRITHVGIYIGNDQFIHSRSTGKDVTISTLDNRYYRKRFVRGGRL